MNNEPDYEFAWKEPVFIDQTAFAAFMNPVDPRYAKARTLFFDLDDLDRPLVTTNYVVFDIHQWLRDQYHYKLAQLFLGTIDQASEQGKLEIVPGDAKLELKARNFILEYPNYSLSLSEALTYVVLIQFGIRRIFTFNPSFSVIPKLRQELKMIPSLG